MSPRLLSFALLLALTNGCVPGCSPPPPTSGGICPREGCPEGLVCDPNDICSLPCSAAEPCGEAGVCSAVSNTCVQCAVDSDCQAAKPFCEASNGICVSRPLSPTKWILGPFHGNLEAGSLAATRIDRLVVEDIPITGFHFDGNEWALPDKNCEFVGGEDAAIARMRTLGIPALIHFWGGCDTEADFERLHAQIGDVLGGFYLDHLADDDFGRLTQQWVRQNLPERGAVVLKAWGNDYSGPQPFSDAYLAEAGHTAYIDDLPTNFEGLQEGIRRVYAKTPFVGAFNEFTAFEYETVEEETYFRRIHWGALQLVMDHSPSMPVDPWDYSTELLRSFRDHAWLHAELTPYLHSYDWRHYETGEPVLRGMNPERFSHRLGDEIFAAFVVQAGVSSLEIELPSGEWIDRWDESRVVSGTVSQPVPLGREPVFFRHGSIIPLDVRRDYLGHGSSASEGSLTVLVYPKGATTFRYRDEGKRSWITLSADEAKGPLELRYSSPPSQPVIWRVSRWPHKPAGVSVEGNSVHFVGSEGNIPEALTAAEAEGATNHRWFYDSAARVVIVKIVSP